MSINGWRCSLSHLSGVTVSRAASPTKAVRLAQCAVRAVAARRARARHALWTSRATMPVLMVSTHSVAQVLSRGGPCRCQINWHKYFFRQPAISFIKADKLDCNLNIYLDFNHIVTLSILRNLTSSDDTNIDNKIHHSRVESNLSALKSKYVL